MRKFLLDNTPGKSDTAAEFWQACPAINGEGRQQHQHKEQGDPDMEYSETTPTVCYEEDEGGNIYVIRMCPDCGRFVREGQLLTNGLGQVKLENWICSKCGQIEPEWFRYP